MEIRDIERIRRIRYTSRTIYVEQSQTAIGTKVTSGTWGNVFWTGISVSGTSYANATSIVDSIGTPSSGTCLSKGARKNVAAVMTGQKAGTYNVRLTGEIARADIKIPIIVF